MNDDLKVRPDSPFLRSRPHDKRPKLRFNTPKQTEEWLASREKTDYTYSKSASYSESKAEGSLHIITNNYPTPIMSRRAQGGAYKSKDNTSITSSVLTGPRRMSSRIAARLGYSIEPLLCNTNNEYCATTSTTTTSSIYSESHQREYEDQSSYDATDASTTSSLSSVRGHLLFSEQYNEKQLDHLYGLDRDEISDTESTSAIHSRSSSVGSISTRSFDPAMSTSGLVMQSITFFCSIIFRIVHTVVEGAKCIVNSFVGVLSSSGAIESSQIRKKYQSLSIIRTIFGNIATFFSSLLSGDSAVLSSSMYHQEWQQKRKKRAGAFLCWLVLLLAILSSGILFCVYNSIFTSSEQESQVKTSFHDIDMQLDKVIERFHNEEITGGVKKGTTGDDNDLGGFVPIDKIQAIVAAGIQKEIVSVNNAILGQQKQLHQQELLIGKLQDRISEMQTVADINNFDVRITRLHNDVRTIKLLGDGRTLDDTFQSITVEVTTLSRNHAHIASEVQKIKKSLYNIIPSLDARFSDQSNSLKSAEQQISIEISKLDTQINQLEAQLESVRQATAPNNDDIKDIVAKMNLYELDKTKLRVQLRDIQSQVTSLVDNEKGKNILETLGTLNTDITNLYSRVDQIETTVGQQAVTVSSLHNFTVNEMGAKFNKLSQDVRTYQQNISSRVHQIQDGLVSTNSQMSSLRSDILQIQEDHKQQNLKIKDTHVIENLPLSSDLILQLSEDVNLLKGHFRNLATHINVESAMDKLNEMIENLTIKVGNIQSGVADDSDNMSLVTLKYLSSVVVEIKDIEQQLDELQVTGQMPFEARHFENTKKSLQVLSDTLAMLRKQADSLALLRTDLDFVMVYELPNLKKDILSNRNYLVPNVAHNNNDYIAQIEKLDSKFTVLLESYAKAQNTVPSGESLQMHRKITDLETELKSLKILKNEMNSLKLIVTGSQNDLSMHKQSLVKIEGQIGKLNVPNDLLSKLSGIDEVQLGISQDINHLKAGIVEIKNHLHVPGSNTWFDINLLDDRVKALDSQIQLIHKELIVSTSRNVEFSQQPIQAVNTLETLQKRLAVLEESIAADEKETQFAIDVSKASQDVILLRKSIEKLATSISAMESTVSEANVEDLQLDVINLKTVLKQLRLDLAKCCKNGSAMAALFMSDESSGVLDFLMSHFVGRHELDLTKQPLSAASLNVTDNLDLEVIRNIVNDLMLVNNADKTGMVDFALESAGGSVISTRCSKTYSRKTALLSIFGIPLWYAASNPRMVIQPDVNPGNCWAFVGTRGFMVIQLSGLVKITSFSLEHIPRSLSPTGNIDSAPNNFSVIGLNHEYDSEGIELGKYFYDQNGSPIQFFAVQKPNIQAFHIVELRIHSNHGNVDYTCLYRFRVHGILQK